MLRDINEQVVDLLKEQDKYLKSQTLDRHLNLDYSNDRTFKDIHSITTLISDFESSFQNIDSKQIEKNLRMIISKERKRALEEQNQNNQFEGHFPHHYLGDEEKIGGGVLSFSDITSNYGNKTNYTGGEPMNIFQEHFLGYLPNNEEGNNHEFNNQIGQGDNQMKIDLEEEKISEEDMAADQKHKDQQKKYTRMTQQQQAKSQAMQSFNQSLHQLLDQMQNKLQNKIEFQNEILSKSEEGKTQFPSGAPNCLTQCFQVPDFQNYYYCSHGNFFGFCCPDNQREQCRENPDNNIYCSAGAANATFMKYAYCQRNTKACVSKGPKLYPLLNQNQSVYLDDTMRFSRGEVCWYELNLDTDQWILSHSIVPLPHVFFKITFGKLSNIDVHMGQGMNRTTTNNITDKIKEGQTFLYPASSGSKVYIVAVSANDNPMKLNFTYSLQSSYYSVDGQDRTDLYNQLEDFDASKFWKFLYFTVALGLIVGFILIFYVCCKNFDPLSDFEERRRQIRKQKTKEDKLKEKEKAQQEKQERKRKQQEEKDQKKGKKGKKVNDDDDDEEDDDQVEQLSRKNASAQRSKINSRAVSRDISHDSVPEEPDRKKNKGKQPLSKPLNTESKLKKDQGNNDYNKRLLDGDNDDY